MIGNIEKLKNVLMAQKFSLENLENVVKMLSCLKELYVNITSFSVDYSKPLISITYINKSEEKTENIVVNDGMYLIYDNGKLYWTTEIGFFAEYKWTPVEDKDGARLVQFVIGKDTCYGGGGVGQPIVIGQGRGGGGDASTSKG